MSANSSAKLMAGNPFKKVTRAKSRLRLALDGPAGSGKSYTALRFAHALAKCISEQEGRPARIAAIDTESGSLAKYAGEVVDDMTWEWDGIDLQDFSPTSYTQLIKLAEQAGFDILIIDSLSHAWSGSGGALDLVDKKKAAGKNAFTDGWRDVTPMQAAMIDAIVRSTCHVIATMRTKTEWVMEKDERGKTVPRKVGMAPVQRAGVEYEFDIVCDIDQETHTLTVSKTRFSGIDNAQIVKPGFNFFLPIFHWLNNGSDVPRAVMDAAAFKTREDHLSPLERAKKRAAESGASRTAEQSNEQAQGSAGSSQPDSVRHDATGADPVVNAETVDKIRKLIAEAFPDQDSSRRWAIARLAEMAATKISELTQVNADKLVIELMERKSAEVLRRANEKLAASGTTSTVDVEPNAVAKTKPEERPAGDVAVTETAKETATETSQANVTEHANAVEQTEHTGSSMATAPPPDAAVLSTEPGTATKTQLDEAAKLSEALDWQHEKQAAWLASKGHKTFRNCSERELDELLKKLRARLAGKN